MAIFTGRRLYTNNVQGTVTDNPLTDSATTLNSAGLANLAAVSSNHAVIVLDPLRAAGAPEVVIVTAHTGAATSATISRGAYGTTPRQHAAGTLWVHPYTHADVIQVLAANPSDNHEGQVWYRSDTDIYMAHNGSAAVEALPIGAWQTPSLTLSAVTTAPTAGTGAVQETRYTRQGRKITGGYRFQFGSSMAAGSGAYLVPLPTAGIVPSGIGRVIGQGYIFDASGSDFRSVLLFLSTASAATHARMFLYNSSSEVAHNSPWTWAQSDQIVVQYAYEAAS